MSDLASESIPLRSISSFKPHRIQDSGTTQSTTKDTKAKPSNTFFFLFFFFFLAFSHHFRAICRIAKLLMAEVIGTDTTLSSTEQ